MIPKWPSRPIGAEGSRGSATGGYKTAAAPRKSFFLINYRRQQITLLSTAPPFSMDAVFAPCGDRLPMAGRLTSIGRFDL